MSGYSDPKHPGNSTEHHSGKACIEAGCDNPAGTAWSPAWCFECNVKRMDRINRHLADIAAEFDKEG